jgi:hypothetical protein
VTAAMWFRTFCFYPGYDRHAIGARHTSSDFDGPFKNLNGPDSIGTPTA